MKELEEWCSPQANLFIFAEEEKVCLSKELRKLQGELSNAETRDVAKYSTLQEYLNDLGIQYVWGFEHFCAQASATFKDLNFSKIEINTEEVSTATMMSDGVEQDVDSVVDEGTKEDD